MRSVGFDRDEPPRGERGCGGRLRPSPDRALRGLGVASGVDARQGRDAVRGSTRSEAKRENPVRSESGGRRPAGMQLSDVAIVAAAGKVALRLSR